MLGKESFQNSKAPKNLPQKLSKLKVLSPSTVLENLDEEETFLGNTCLECCFASLSCFVPLYIALAHNHTM